MVHVPSLALSSIAGLAIIGRKSIGRKIRRRKQRQRLAANLPLWHQFIAETDSRLQAPNYTIHAPKDKCAVIVEPREHPELSYVLRNVMHFLDDSWGLQIFHSRQNAAFVQRCVQDWGDVKTIEFCDGNIDGKTYNRLLCNPWFWEQISSEHILHFQTDSILRKRGVDHFLEYDFVGAPFPPTAARNYGESVPIPVGCGGISLRRRSSTLEICEKWPIRKDRNEDLYFAELMTLHGYHLPDVATAGRFSVEALYFADPISLHKPWPWLDPEQMNALLEIDYTSTATPAESLHSA